MPALIPDLSPDIKLDAIAPKTILERQADFFRKKYKGYLDADVTTVTGAKDDVIHRLDLIALQLDEMRVRLLTATHRMEYYPVQIEAECFKPKRRNLPISAPGLEEMLRSRPLPEEHTWPRDGDWRPVAWDQAAFIEKVGEVLKSGEVRAAMESIIARTNEKQLLADPSAA